MNITIDTSDLASPLLANLRRKLTDKTGLHARMAGEAERFVKTRGMATAAGEHRSANRLGAAPTGHLEKAYQQIESQSGADAASLLVPRASRLRAAFGAYVVRPGAGKTYLTIPVAAAAYGKRAGEIEGLEFMRVGPNKTPILAKPDGKDRITTYFILVKKADIAEDAGLIPFPELYQQAADAAELYLLEENLI